LLCKRLGGAFAVVRGRHAQGHVLALPLCRGQLRLKLTKGSFFLGKLRRVLGALLLPLGDRAFNLQRGMSG
jgi:hypothetical protein